MQEITRSTALQRAKNYKNAKSGFQTSVYWAVTQALHGNADGLYLIMLHAGMLNGTGGEMTKLADGRQLWTYWNDPNGLGLKGLLDWDKNKTRFKMTSGWRQVIQDLDLPALHIKLTTTLWSKFEKKKGDDPAFDLEKALEQLIKKAGNNGYAPETLHTRLGEMLGLATAKSEPDPVDLADAAAAAIMTASEPVKPSAKTRKPKTKTTV